MSTPPLMQTVTLVLDDGRRLTYTGPVQLPAEEIAAARVVGIVFGLPQALPPGCAWETLEEGKSV